MKRGELTLMAIVAFVIGYLLATLVAAAEAHGAEPLSSAMARLPTFHEDAADERKPGQIAAIAKAIEEASQKPPGGLSRKDWQALLVAVGFWESTFSLRILAGDCKPHECDRGRARSAWQLHRNLFTAPVWDRLIGEDIELQAQTASDMLKRAFATCSRSGAHWLSGTINAYAGRRCGDTSWPGRAQREKTWADVRRRL